MTEEVKDKPVREVPKDAIEAIVAKPDDRDKDKSVVSMRQLLETGVHFGHQTKRWNPKMKKYIFTARNDIHVIDLQKTLKKINEAHKFIKTLTSKGGVVLFVGTKKQAQDTIAEEATRAGMPYVCNRWLGGMLTNFETIRKSLYRLRQMEETKTNGGFDSMSSKEQSRFTKQMAKMEFNLNGIRILKKVPDAVFIVDTHKETIAVAESRRLNIPVVGVVDTNCDPDVITYPIPANDDAIRTIRLLASIVCDACLEGKKLFNGTGIESAVEEMVAESITIPAILDELSEDVQPVTATNLTAK